MKQIFKKIFTGLGYAVGGVFVVAMLLAVSPILIGAIVYFGSIALYTRLWVHIRHDPKCDLMIEGLISETWPEAETKEAFVNEFDKVASIIATMSQAKRGEFIYDGFSIFDEPNLRPEWTNLNLSQTLHTKHAEVVMTFDFGAHYSDSQGRIIVAAQNDDDQHEGDLPPIALQIIVPKLHTERSVMLTTYEDVWLAISLLRGAVKFTTKEGQLWAHIPEHNVWLVRYKASKSDYGLRVAFTGNTARKYTRDTPIQANTKN